MTDARGNASESTDNCETAAYTINYSENDKNKKLNKLRKWLNREYILAQYMFLFIRKRHG